MPAVPPRGHDLATAVTWGSPGGCPQRGTPGSVPTFTTSPIFPHPGGWRGALEGGTGTPLKRCCHAGGAARGRGGGCAPHARPPRGWPAVPAGLSSPGIGSSRREGAWSLFNVPSPAGRAHSEHGELSRSHGIAAGRGHGDPDQCLPPLLGQGGRQVQAEQEGAQGAAAERAGVFPGDPEGRGGRGEDHAGPG